MAKLDRVSLASFRETYLVALQGYQNWPDGRVLVDKLPLNMGSLPLIARLFPNARFIVALRHPCDCILSNYMQDFSLNPSMHMMLDLEEQVHFIRYEALVADFDTEVGQLLGFIRVGWDPAVTKYHEHARKRGTLGAPSIEGVTREIYQGAVGRWLRYAGHPGALEPFLKDVSGRTGYSLEGLPVA